MCRIFWEEKQGTANNGCLWVGKLVVVAGVGEMEFIFPVYPVSAVYPCMSIKPIGT